MLYDDFSIQSIYFASNSHVPEVLNASAAAAVSQVYTLPELSIQAALVKLLFALGTAFKRKPITVLALPEVTPPIAVKPWFN